MGSKQRGAEVPTSFTLQSLPPLIIVSLHSMFDRRKIVNFALSEEHKMLQATVRDFDYFAPLLKLFRPLFTAKLLF